MYDRLRNGYVETVDAREMRESRVLVAETVRVILGLPFLSFVCSVDTRIVTFSDAEDDIPSNLTPEVLTWDSW